MGEIEAILHFLIVLQICSALFYLLFLLDRCDVPSVMKPSTMAVVEPTRTKLWQGSVVWPPKSHWLESQATGDQEAIDAEMVLRDGIIEHD